MSQVLEVKVPDIGDFKDVPIIEVLVKPGDTVSPDAPLITLESDKATMDVPAPAAGTVSELKVKVGDKVSEGTVILTLVAGGQGVSAAAAEAAPAGAPAAPASQPVLTLVPPSVSALPAGEGPAVTAGGIPAASESGPHPQSLSRGEREASSAPGAMEARTAHASPSVRRFARELGVDISKVPGSGPKNRILHEDIQNYVKGVMAQAPTAAPAAAAGGALDLLPWPKIDFAKFGPIESKPLLRIKKISAANLARNWVMIPHVTQHDEADITDLEAFRVKQNKEYEKAGIKLTMLAFLVKACVAALKKYPEFNSSLDGENLVLKQYYHIGFAADTPNGLVVPVLRDADRKGVIDIVQEMGALAKKAREGKIAPTEMQGGCFTISSLGGIGGTAFTPIINAPEVAILGVSKSQTKPIWNGTQFVPRLILPLSLSYDHRVIDGAGAARFTSYLTQLLADMRRVLM
jgi:pyruvate dehydrogenase E2 component (dihydrolipoamide acetyltransferase)